jgi:hypothetical protein
MKPKPSEAINFFWHCLVASKVMDELPTDKNPATKAHYLNAVRLATVCIAGAEGVHYASEDAQAVKEKSGAAWNKCRLIKEHVVPVSVIAGFVHEELGKPADRSRLAGMLARIEAVGVPAAVLELFAGHPRALQVAGVVLEWTTLAWITKSENRRFGEKDRHGGISISKRMPEGWTPAHDRLARHRACEIPLVPI